MTKSRTGGSPAQQFRYSPLPLVCVNALILDNVPLALSWPLHIMVLKGVCES